jgi:cobalt-zinc-cadmium efflux system outer membrane protein
VAQSARLQVVRIGWLERRIAVANAELKPEEDTLGALQAALEQGDATLSDVGVQLAAVEGLRRSLGELRRAAVEARGELDRLLGLPGTTELPVVLPQSLDDGARSYQATALIDVAVDRRLDLLALRRGYDAQEAVVRAAVLAQLPSLTVGVAHQRNESALKFMGGFVTLGLPIFGHPRAIISQEEATRTRLGHELTARAAAVRADIRTLLATLDELELQIRVAHDAVDRLEPVADATREAAVGGDVDRLSEQVVLTALAEARLELAALRQARDETLTGLETAVGCPLGSVVALESERQP